MKMMKIRDLLKFELDVDIYNDYIDGVIPAFCGPQGLTEAGEEHYKEVLDLDVELDPRPDPKWAEVKLDHFPQKKADDLYGKVSEFFWDCAGYIDENEYEKYFKED